MKTQLSVKESAKLIELGVNASQASEKEKVYVSQQSRDTALMYQVFHHYAPIFTLTDILDILPKEIKIHRDGDTLSMIYHCGQWRVGYSNCAEYCNHTKVAPELIDVLYSLLVWCLEKGYVKLD